MSSKDRTTAALAIDGISGGARGGFELASDAGYRGVSFATNHPELRPDELGESARRHLLSILSGKELTVQSLRIAVPRSSLTDPATIDQALQNARRGMQLARDLGVSTVSLHVGNIGDSKTPADTLVAALRELAQVADATGLTLALGSASAGALMGILKRVDYEHATINLDPGRLIDGAEDPLKVAEELATLGIGQFTATDAVRSGNSVRGVFLGEGQVALPELMEILTEQGFRGPTVVDVRGLNDAAAGARHAAQVLMKLQRGIGGR